MRQLLVRFKTVYGSYFGFAGDKKYHTLAVAAIIACQIGMMFAIPMLTLGLGGVLSAFTTAELTYALYFSAIARCFVAAGIYATGQALTTAITNWLSWSLGANKQRDLVERYTKESVALLVKEWYVSNKNDSAPKDTKLKKEKITAASIDAGSVLPKNPATKFISLATSFLGALLQGVIAIITLWTLSPIVVIAAMVYALLYNTVISFFKEKLKTAKKQTSAEEDNLQNETAHLCAHAKEITIFGANEFHKNSIVKVIHNQQKALKDFLNNLFKVRFVKAFHEQSMEAVGLLAAAPGIIAKTITATQAFMVIKFFAAVIELLTWPARKVEELAKLEPSLNKLYDFESALAVCESKNLEQQQTIHNKTGAEISVKTNLYIPSEGTQKLLRAIDIKIEPGFKMIEVQGKNGCGKSTLQRIMTAAWHVLDEKTNISFPSEKTERVSLPQAIIFPLTNTLWDNICYPLENVEKTQKLKETLLQWMRRFKLDDAHINKITESTADEATACTYSGGEKQIFRLLSLLVKKSVLASQGKKLEFVFMDEAFSALDAKKRKVVQAFLKTEFPDTTFLCIHHEETPPAPNADSGSDTDATETFYTHRLVFSEDSTDSPQLTVLQPITAPKAA